VHLYELGLTGTADAAGRRDKLCRAIGFPSGMTPNALLSALSMLYTPEELRDLVEKL